MEYTSEWVLKRWKEMGTLDGQRVVYEKGETGWVLPLDDGNAIIVNLPLSGDLRFLDVVTLKPETVGGVSDWMVVGDVIFRSFTHTVTVHYPETEDGWKMLRDGLKGAGIFVEGYVDGLCRLNYNDGQDVLGALRDAGFRVTRISVETT